MKNLFSLLLPVLLIGQTLYADTQTLAPGYAPLQFEAPTPGSYTLPVIGRAADGTVLSSDNQSQQLHELMGDKIVLLSFIYSTCSDVNGCPLATAVFHKIKRRLLKEPQLAKQLRLLTLSFNPEHDTPEAMRHYGSGLTDKTVDWRFLTTASERQLQPILDNYQQSIQKIYDEKGNFTGTFSHILRVYLIDKDKQLRNIYSVSFLHADTLINDVKTLLAENGKTSVAAQPENIDQFQAGDDKQRYDQSDYQTHSIALTHRRGQATDLMNYFNNPPLGLPAPFSPDDNPVTEEKVALGRKLFYDRRLSLNNTFSCAMCHVPEQGFSSNEIATAVGIEGRSVRRNSPTLYNVAYAPLLFHDGRENTLEQQVWGPLLAHNEMGNPSIGYVIDKIKGLPDYAGLFENVFNKAPTMETIGQAIASYERTLNSADSPFDRWFFGKRENAVNESAKRGFKLFSGKAGCSSCHRIERSHVLFSDYQLHNTGIGYREAMLKPSAKQKVQLAPGVFIEVDSDTLAAVSGPKPNDLGRYEITQNPKDRWKYKTPTLRNIALTAPYMHNGSLSTLEEVVRFYNQGGIANENLDPSIKPLHLTENDIGDLVAFLQSLTGSNVDELVADAYAAPIGDL
ncbi:cytochrome c peroxidase [Methylomarinum vadi]|uniref:cytochrome c peroxidase n=1 Tax=Methylomarinum vadi TaxID=438855 RepID=UPI0004DFAF7B|nr:cytochrome c peroxidase [Methylomarinum vadi]